ncbi:MAG TPA: diaminopimelate epimerase [Acidimicrobiales bacterium]|nr:diaminopimelate epimerase [Acidimicrobiales bacterium]
MPHLTLTKHHGLGNDFLVVLEPAASIDLAALAIALCDRRRGIGADGLIAGYRSGAGGTAGEEPSADQHAPAGTAAPPTRVITMVLHNADGSRAEMSGNGIRCLAQAVVDAGWTAEGRFPILTDAGVRLLDVGPEEAPGLRSASVGMGPARVVRLGEGEAEVDTGNPHHVRIVDDPASVDLEAMGAARPDVNVEIVRVDADDRVTMRVHERGAGITEACGTGSCAIVAATVAWGMTGRTVTVHNPGGDLTVTLTGDDATLTGPAQRIATIDVEV